MIPDTAIHHTTQNPINSQENIASHDGINHVIDINNVLNNRLILEAAQVAGWLPHKRYQYDGWKMPLQNPMTGEIVDYLWKNADNTIKGHKYRPLGKSLSNHWAATWYIPNPDKTRQAIIASGGIAWVANGAPSLLAYRQAGILNSIAGRLENAVPEKFIEVCEHLGITTLYYPVDNDDTGRKTAIKWANACHNTDIDFKPLEWPQFADDTFDANDLLIHCEGDKQLFSEYLHNLKGLPLPKPEPKPLYDASDYGDTDKNLIAEIRQHIRLTNRRYGDNGIHCHCPHHEDNDPDAVFYEDTGIIHCFACGKSFSPKKTAQKFGFWHKYAPKKIRPKKARKHANMQKRVLSNDFSQWASPIDLPSIEATLQVNERYVSAIDKGTFETVFNAHSVLIKSAIGTGKTQLLHKMIEAAQRRLKREPRVLIISHRQNLASDIDRRFKDLGFILYSEFQGTGVNWQGHNRIISSYDSLHKLAGQKFDIVAIDEFEQFIGHSWGGTMRKGENYRAVATLLHFTHNAKQFIGLDAHITQKSQDIVQQWRKGQVTTLENTYRHDWGNVTVCQHDNAVFERAFNAVGTANKPVVLLSSSRTVTNNLYQLALDYGITPDDIVLINADTSSQKDTQKYLANLNESIKETKLLILSPSVDTGYDIQTPVHGVYAIFNREPLIPTKMLQMLNRCRNAGERWAYVQYADNQDYETSSEKIESEGLNKALWTSKAANFDYQIDPLQMQINRLYAIWQADENKQRNMLFSSFIAYAQAEGYTIQYQDKQSAVFKDLYKQAKVNLAERIKNLTLDTEAISRDEYRYLKLNGLADETSRAGLNRWHIEDVTGRMITPELYDTFYNPRQRAALHQFMNLQEDKERLKDFDRQEADNQTLLIKRKHLTVKYELIVGAIQTVFGNDGLGSQIELTADEIADSMADYIEENLTSIQLYLDKRADLSEKKINILRRILKRAGIKLNGRQVMVNGERFYRYSIDQKHLETWRDYARTGLIYRRLKAEYGDKARDYLKRVNNPLCIRVLSNEQGEQGSSVLTEGLELQTDKILEGIPL